MNHTFIQNIRFLLITLLVMGLAEVSSAAGASDQAKVDTPYIVLENACHLQLDDKYGPQLLCLDMVRHREAPENNWEARVCQFWLHGENGFSYDYSWNIPQAKSPLFQGKAGERCSPWEKINMDNVMVHCDISLLKGFVYPKTSEIHGPYVTGIIPYTIIHNR